MSASRVLRTAAEFDRYPSDEATRCELDPGELIEMTRTESAPLDHAFALALDELFD